MEKLIAYCGLNCETCDIRVATIKNDDDLRKVVAEKVKKHYKISSVPLESINCMGCRTDGIKYQPCKDCKIVACVISKNYETCGDCPELESCDIVLTIHKYEPKALENLKRLSNS